MNALSRTLAATAPCLMALLTAPTATADNSRLNSTVISNVYTVQRQAGCTGQLTPQPQLRLAAQRHVADVLANPDLNGDIGSDGTDPQRRAAAFGYQGEVSETVAINPGLAISGIELINQWFANAAYLATMRDCRFTQIGVWSENSINRSVVVATYGNPSVGSGEKG